MTQQKERLKTDGLNILLNELQANLESPETPEEMAPGGPLPLLKSI